MTEQVQQIAIEKIVPNPDNRRVGGFDPVKLQQLADSIKDVGIQQPIIVRTRPSGGFELIAGERRWRAGRIAGLDDVPAIVRELDDLQVLKIQTVENLQREDVHPLDEADGFARLIEKAGYEVDQVAAEIGKSASYVYQRLKLKDLIEPARKLFVEDRMAAGHAILIARLGPEQQREIVKECFASWRQQEGREISVRELDMWIRREILMDLSKVTWKHADADLVQKAGPCSRCPKRTGHTPALFADVSNDGKKDFCLDRVCFNAKLDAVVARREKEVEGQPLLRIDAKYGRTPGTVSKYDVAECKKGERGAVRTLIVNGPERGKLGWAKPTGFRAKSRAADENPAELEKLRAERAKGLLEGKVRRLTARRTWDAVIEAAANHPSMKKDLLPLPVFQLVVEKVIPWQLHGVIEKECGHLSPTAEYSELLMRLVMILAAPALDPDRLGSGEVKNVAKLYKVDVAAIERQVKAELTKKTEKKAKDPDYIEMLEEAHA